jgi:hypothetical protein
MVSQVVIEHAQTGRVAGICQLLTKAQGGRHIIKGNL